MLETGETCQEKKDEVNIGFENDVDASLQGPAGIIKSKKRRITEITILT